MWGDQDKEEHMVTPKYLNSVTNSKGEPKRHYVNIYMYVDVL